MREISDSQLIKNCWLKIKSAKGAEAFIDEFYEYMLEHHPDVQSFFPADLTLQKTKLLNSLDNVINGFEYIEELKEELVKLGEQHKCIGIKAEMFDHFITAIVATASSASDFTLTKHEIAAWENAFRKISDIMLKAY